MDNTQVIDSVKSLYANSEEIKQRNSDFLHIFRGSPQGKRIYDYLSKFCFKKECTFDSESARRSDFKAGVRAVILEIDYWMEYDLSSVEKAGETENIEPEEDRE